MKDMYDDMLRNGMLLSMLPEEVRRLYAMKLVMEQMSQDSDEKKKNDVINAEFKVLSDPRVISDDVADRRRTLMKIAETLKSEYFGIDNEIDTIISLIKMWWLYPHLQTRPTIVSLFGLSGVGKTSLVKRLVQLLGLNDKFCLIEMDNVSNSDITRNIHYGDHGAKTILSRLSECDINPKDQCVLMMDEFHRFRKIDPDGNYIYDEYFQDTWRLLDNGSLYDKVYIMRYIDTLINQLERRQRSAFNEDENYSNTDSLSEALGMNNGMRRGKSKMEQFMSGNWNIADGHLLCNILPITQNDVNMLFMIRTAQGGGIDGMMNNMSTFGYETRQLNTPEDTMKMLLQTSSNFSTLQYLRWKLAEMRKSDRDTTIDTDDFEYRFTKMLIFVCGNIDEFYTDKEEVTETALTYEAVKKKLESYFRPEQISRLGDKFVIYPILTRDAFVKMMEAEIDKFVRRANSNYSEPVMLDEDVANIKKSLLAKQWNLRMGVRPFVGMVNRACNDALQECMIRHFAEDEDKEVKNG